LVQIGSEDKIFRTVELLPYDRLNETYKIIDDADCKIKFLNVVKKVRKQVPSFYTYFKSTLNINSVDIQENKNKQSKNGAVIEKSLNRQHEFLSIHYYSHKAVVAFNRLLQELFSYKNPSFIYGWKVHGLLFVLI